MSYGNVTKYEFPIIRQKKEMCGKVLKTIEG
jgi:hypothetical protein